MGVASLLLSVASALDSTTACPPAGGLGAGVFGGELYVSLKNATETSGRMVMKDGYWVLEGATDTTVDMFVSVQLYFNGLMAVYTTATKLN